MFNIKSGSKPRSNKCKDDEEAATSMLSERPLLTGSSNPPPFSADTPHKGMSRIPRNPKKELTLITTSERVKEVKATKHSPLSPTLKDIESDELNPTSKDSSSSSGISCPRNNIDDDPNTKEWVPELELSDSDESDPDLLWKEILGKTTKTPKSYSCNYVEQIQKELNVTQKAFLSLSTQYTRLQFMLRQVIEADPPNRDRLLNELKGHAYGSDVDSEFQLALQYRVKKRNPEDLQDLRHRQSHIIGQLRSQLEKLQLLTYDNNCRVHKKPNAGHGKKH